MSLVISLSKAKPSRTAMMAMPWRPSGPLTTTASPGRAFAGSGAKPSWRVPTPVVFTNMPSAFPRSTTFVSPVTRRTPALAAASAMASRIRSMTSKGRPSSRMKPAVR